MAAPECLGRQASATGLRPAFPMQGVVRIFDPQTGEGIVVRDTDREEFVLAANALEDSIFQMLRQGQRVNFTLDDAGRATTMRLGSEPDMGILDAQI